MRVLASMFPAGRVIFGCAALSAISLSYASSAHAAIDCSAIMSAADSSGFSTLAPIADELAPIRSNRTVGVDQAIARMQQQQCRSMASASPPPAQSGGNSFRFNMTQNGKRMTADEFDAWMKAQGVRVVKGPMASATPTPAPAPTSPPPTSSKKKKKP